MSVALCTVSDQPLDVAGHEAAAASADGGASVTFCGVVRRNDHGREVVELEYQGHPTASAVLAATTRRARVTAARVWGSRWSARATRRALGA